MELEIKGNKKYIKYLHKHLKKEHPSTIGKMKIEEDNSKIGKTFLNKLTGGKK